MSVGCTLKFENSMMGKISQITFVAVLLLVGCRAPAQTTPTASPAPSLTPTNTPEAPPASQMIPSAMPTLTPLSPTSDLEAIRQRMLHSYENWHSLWVQIHVFSRVETLPGLAIRPGLDRLQVWVRQPGEVLVLGGCTGDCDPAYYFVSNGTRWLEADLDTGVTREGDVDPGILAPFVPPQAMTGTIAEFPLNKYILPPAGDMIFPTGLAQRQGAYGMIGDIPQTRRPDLILSFTPEENQGTVEWLDVDPLTGLLLSWQVFSQIAGGEQVQLASLEADRHVYNAELAPGLFELKVPPRLHFQEGPEWNVIY